MQLQRHMDSLTRLGLAQSMGCSKHESAVLQPTGHRYVLERQAVVWHYAWTKCHCDLVWQNAT